MVVPVDREGKVGDCAQLHRDSASAASLEPVSTRKAGGRRRKTNDEEPHKVRTANMYKDSGLTIIMVKIPFSESTNCHTGMITC